ncbi:shikimate kinase [Opitutia bacterium ISCC 51]|nr:shikimate kinase [Opitutae bacterium ISCC 51]QXD27479.1 shikimate kinase [Opitutae bacterium ISCC 52]
MSNSSRPNIYLVGFMGTGKSTIGRQLAQQLEYTFIDSDHAIEAKAGISIPEIFETQGESAFRAMEKAFVESGHDSEGCVVSTGGGLVFQPGLTEMLQAKGVVITLFASPETVYERTRSNKNRPLLNVEDPKVEIERLLKERTPIYSKAGIGVLTDGRGVNDIVSHIIRIYRRKVGL